jgi:hypothetical protein
MSSINTSDIANSISSLEEDGSNWYMFQQKFQAAVKYKRIWGHFYGSAKKPAAVTATPSMMSATGTMMTTATAVSASTTAGSTTGMTGATSTRSQGAPSTTSSMTSDLEKWQNNESLAKYLLITKMLDSVIAKYLHHTTMAKKWRTIVKEFMSKSMMMQSSLYLEFMAMRYDKGENGSLQKELDVICLKHKMLLNVGVTMSENNYRTLTTNFLPTKISNFVAAMSASIKVLDESDDDSDDSKAPLKAKRKPKVLKA